MADVVLQRMTPEEYVPFREALVASYGAAHAKAGRWTAEEAPAAAAKEIDTLLPKGVGTEDHHLFTVHEAPGSPSVGVLWLAKRPDGAFVYELEIDEAHRRRGLGRATMLAAEQVAREIGTTRIALHVFGENTTARELYRSLGYAETNVMMAKPLLAPRS